jgi:mRNA-degrading endonuclease RelE of RelBE toxin-antitoxin system
MSETVIIFTERFKNDLLRVDSKKILTHILDDMDLLCHMPKMGSKDIPVSIKNRFGSAIRKLSIPPFCILYEVSSDADLIVILGMIHQRQAK